MTISDVRGHGRQKGHKEVYRGQEYNVDLLPKVRFDLVVPAERLDEVVDAITKRRRDPGKIGDGEIFGLRCCGGHSHSQRRQRRRGSLIPDGGERKRDGTRY